MTELSLPDQYNEYVKRLAKDLEDVGATTSTGETIIDGRRTVIMAALNLLSEFMEKIQADTDQEQALRLQILAELSLVRKLED